MRLEKIHFLYLIILTLIILLTGSLFWEPKEEAPLSTPIKIGVVLPLSGVFSQFGTLGLQGAEMAVKEINDSGGVLGGKQLKLLVEDNESDPNVGVRKMRRLIQENEITAFLGPVSSSARNAMVEVARKFKVPLLYGIDYEGGHFDRYLFCYSPIPDHVINPLLPYLAKHHGTSFYVFGYDYVWPHEMANAITKEVEQFGGEIKGIEFTPFGVHDFSPAIERIKDSGADVLILVMCGQDGQRFAKQFFQKGMKDRIQLVAIAAEETWQQALTVEELEGIITNVHFISSADSPETRSFVKRAKVQFGEDTVVTYATESHYGLMMLLKNAIEKAGSAENAEKLIDAMTNLQITGGNGIVTIRDDHHMNLNMMIGVYRKRTLVVGKNLGLIIPKDQRHL